MKWEEVTFESIIIDSQNGIGKSKEFYGRGEKVANIGDLYENPKFEPIKYSLLEVSDNEIEKYRLFKDDLLFVRSSVKREGVAYCSVYNSEEVCLFSSFMIRIQLDKSKAYPLFISYLLRWDKMRARLINESNTATITNISQEGLRRLKIPLPPLSEQRRIAEVLDGADALRRLDRELVGRYDALIQSVFYDMFGDPVKNEKGWEVRKLGEVGKITTGNTPSRLNLDFFGDYVEWIKTDNINTGQMFLTPAREYLSRSGELLGRVVNPGAILVTCIAGSRNVIGNVAIADRKVSFNQQINAIEPYENNSFFIYVWFLMAKEYVQSFSTNSMKGMINKSKFESIEMIYPPVHLQIKFGEAIAEIQTQKKLMNEGLQQSDNFFNCLMSHFFYSY